MLSEQELRDWVTDASVIHGRRALDVVPADVFLEVVERLQRAEEARTPQSCAGCLRVCGVRDSIRGCEDCAGVSE